MTRTVPALLMIALLGLVATPLLGHCQIPCGIYNDDARFLLMHEDVTTIEKSMTKIIELSANPQANMNQLVRWVQNKEEHADRLAETVTYYFMTQRIKPADPSDEAAWAKYQTSITLLHQMLVTAMKAKQTTELAHAQTLHGLIDKFTAHYKGKTTGE